MRLRELVRGPAFTCKPSTTLVKAAHLLNIHDAGSLVVVDDDGKIRGIVTDRDLAVKGYGRQLPSDSQVEQVMSRSVATIGLDADSNEAATKMANTGIRRLPVINERGELCGVIAFDDLMIFVEQEGDTLRRALAAQARPGSGGWAGGWD